MQKLAILCLIPCALLLGLSCLSFGSTFGIASMSAKSSASCSLSQGRILFIKVSIPGSDSFAFTPETRFFDFPIGYHSTWSQMGEPMTDNFQSAAFAIPGFVTIPALAATSILLLRSATRSKTAESSLACTECGYDLRGGHDRCPECGLKTPNGQRKFR